MAEGGPLEAELVAAVARQVAGEVPPLGAELLVRAVVSRESEERDLGRARESGGRAAPHRLAHRDPSVQLGLPGCAGAGAQQERDQQRACRPAPHSSLRAAAGGRVCELPGRIDAGQDRGSDRDRDRLDEQRRFDRHLQRPAEGAHVDDVDHQPGQQQPDGQREETGDQPHQTGLQHDELPGLPRRHAVGPQYAELAHALELQRHQRAEHADEGHEHDEQAQHRRDREGAIEDDDRLLADRAIRAHDDLALRSRRRAERLHVALDVGAGLEEEGDPRECRGRPQERR